MQGNPQEAETPENEQFEYLMAMVKANRRMLAYGSSIKAGISSLLSDDILLDDLGHHEILELVDDSTDHLCDMLSLCLLALRSETNSLQFHMELYAPGEILMHARQLLLDKYPHLEITYDLPAEGKPVLADYEFLSMALMLLMEVIKEKASLDQLHIAASEDIVFYTVALGNMNFNMLREIKEIIEERNAETRMPNRHPLSAEQLFRLRLASHILSNHKTKVIIKIENQEEKAIRLGIPINQ